MKLADLHTLFGTPVQNFELIVDKPSLFAEGDAVTINEFGEEFPCATQLPKTRCAELGSRPKRSRTGSPPGAL